MENVDEKNQDVIIIDLRYINYFDYNKSDRPEHVLYRYMGIPVIKEPINA